MGTLHFLLALLFHNGFTDARPFYDDADENNAKFLEAILYEKTDTLKAAISLLSQLNLPLLCQSVASDPHAQFATVADLLHFATVVVEAQQENNSSSDDQMTYFSTALPTIPFDKITSVYPKAVTETVTMAAEDSMEITFPVKDQMENDYKPVEELDHKDKVNGKLLSKQTVVVKSVDSIYAENGLESASRLMKNKSKGSDHSNETSLKPDTDNRKTKTRPTAVGITVTSRTVSRSADRHTATTTLASTEAPTVPTTTEMQGPTQTTEAFPDDDNDIVGQQITQKAKRPRNPYLDRSDQKPSFPTSVLSDLGTTTPLHWLIRDKWPEMEQKTQEMLKERQITSEELSREMVENGNTTFANSTNSTLDTATNATEVPATKVQLTSTSKTDTTQISSTSPKPVTTTLKQTTETNTPTKPTHVTTKVTKPVTTPEEVKVSKTTTVSKITKQTPSEPATSSMTKMSSSTTLSTNTIPSSSPKSNFSSTSGITTLSLTQLSNITKVTTTLMPSTKKQATTSEAKISFSVNESSSINPTTMRSVTTPPANTTKSTRPRTTPNTKISDKKSTSINITRILDMIKTATPVIRLSSTKVSVTIKPTPNVIRSSTEKTTTATSSPKPSKDKQKHITLKRGHPTTTSPTVTRSNVTNITSSITPRTTTESQKNVSTETVTKAEVTTTTTPKTSTTSSTTVTPTSVKTKTNTTSQQKSTTTLATTSTKLPTTTTVKKAPSTKQIVTTKTSRKTTPQTTTQSVAKLSTIKKQDTTFQTKGVNYPWGLENNQKPTLREKIVPVQNSRDSERTDVTDYGNEITEGKSNDNNYIAPGQTDDDSFGFFTCPTIFGFYPDAINCGQFYICSWSIPYHFDCPVGTVWNTELTVCDWPFNVNCGSRPWFGRSAFEKHFLPRQL